MNKKASKCKEQVEGKVYSNKKGQLMEVIEYRDAQHVVVRFLISNYTVAVRMDKIKEGSVKDWLSPSIFSRGIVGDTHPTQLDGKDHPISSMWRGVLQRVYDTKFLERRPTYKGCSVVDDWLYYPTFYGWVMQEIDGDLDRLEGLQLDKDILCPSNKVYSPTTCLLVSSQLNSLLTKCDASRGSLPIGVNWDKVNNKFVAKCSVEGVRQSIGGFDTVQEAAQAYCLFKGNHILSVALQQTDMRLVKGLIRHAQLYLRGEADG